MAAAKKITAWSYSRWTTYEDCPLKAKLKFVDRLPEPGSSAMDRGSAIHALAEQHATGRMSGKPEEKLKAEAFREEFEKVILPGFKKEFAEAKKGNPKAEQEWAFTANWQPTDWFGGGAWCRVKTDLVFTRKKELVIVDHKTGKRRDSHHTQLSLYAMAGFLMYEEVENIRTELWYLDDGKPIKTETYERSELGDILDAWEARTTPMLNDTIFAPKPSRACSWCHFRKENGGPCKF